MESVLRYGVPPRFAAFVIKPKSSSVERRLRSELADIFKDSASAGNFSRDHEMDDGKDLAHIPGVKRMFF